MCCPFCKCHYFSSPLEALKVKAAVELKGTGVIAKLILTGCPCQEWASTTEPGPGLALGPPACAPWHAVRKRFPITPSHSLQSLQIPPAPFSPGWSWRAICPCHQMYVAIHHKELTHRDVTGRYGTLWLLNDVWLCFDQALRWHTREKMSCKLSL